MPVPAPQPGPDGWLRAEVLWVDRFGNAQLNVRPAEADQLGRLLDLRVRSRTWPARRVAAYGELGEGQVGLVTDSYGLLAVSCRGVPAAVRVGLTSGDEVWIGHAEG
jgi:S-adenosylmethionine hydrolase